VLVKKMNRARDGGYMPLIQALWRLTKEDGKFEANLDYRARLYLKERKW
jgi:hypothetical protein